VRLRAHSEFALLERPVRHRLLLRVIHLNVLTFESQCSWRGRALLPALERIESALIAAGMLEELPDNVMYACLPGQAMIWNP